MTGKPTIRLRGIPRRDSAEGRGYDLTVGGQGGLLALLAGVFPGSGSVRLGPSQKGDLPSSGERITFVGPMSPTRAIPNGKPRPDSAQAVDSISWVGRYVGDPKKGPAEAGRSGPSIRFNAGKPTKI